MSKTLEEARSFLSSIDWINMGGCGVAAYYMAYTLKQLGEKCYIVYGYYASNKEELLTNMEYDKKKTVSTCPHIFIFHNDKFFDAVNPVYPQNYKYVEFSNDLDRLRDTILKGKWNECFDRDRYIPEIEKFFRHDLNSKLKTTNLS